jgi:hypothetical protein
MEDPYERDLPGSAGYGLTDRHVYLLAGLVAMPTLIHRKSTHKVQVAVLVLVCAPGS